MREARVIAWVCSRKRLEAAYKVSQEYKFNEQLPGAYHQIKLGKTWKGRG